MTRIITFLTDFGLTDNFVAVMKAVILSINPKAQIIDISHSIPPQDVRVGAVLLKYSYSYFPKGTIHLSIIDPGVGSKRRPIIIKSRNYIFIGPDNGLLYPSSEADRIEKIIRITKERYFLKPVSDTFHGRDIFSPVAGFVSKGLNLENFGKTTKDIKRLIIPKVNRTANILIGEVIYIDRFGNLITNISRDDFLEFTKKDAFKIRIKGKMIAQLSTSYIDAKKNQPLCIFGSFSTLEIAMKETSARDYLDADLGTKVELIKSS